MVSLIYRICFSECRTDQFVFISLTVLLIALVCVVASLTSSYVACLADQSVVICLTNQFVVEYSSHKFLKMSHWSHQFEKCFSGVLDLDSSGKSQKPIFSKLENYFKTQNTSSTSVLRPLLSYISTKIISGVSSEAKTFYYLVNKTKRSCYDK